MTAPSSGENSVLATKCMDFRHALASQGKMFQFSLTIGTTFTFSLDTREGKETLPARNKKSPSTLKRNAKRRQEFLKKKSESNQMPAEKNDAFQCDHCEVVFKTRNGLKIHIGKTHKETVKSPEKLRETSPKLPLAVSPPRVTSRIVPCNNCGEEMSSTHLCEEDLAGVEAGEGIADGGRLVDGDQAAKGICTCDCEFPICCNCLHDQECSCCDHDPNSGVCSCEGYVVHH